MTKKTLTKAEKKLVENEWWKIMKECEEANLSEAKRLVKDLSKEGYLRKEEKETFIKVLKRLFAVGFTVSKS